MKYFLLAAAALIAGTSLGLGTTISEFGGVRERFEPWADGTESRPTQNIDIEKPPQFVDKIVGSKVEVEGGEVYNFGTMQRKGKLSNRFVFKNVGTAPLYLKEQGTSCPACTFVTFTSATVAVGESLAIEIQWEAKQNESEFRKEVYVATSDPDKPLVRLIIEGTVTTAVRVLPPELIFNQVPANTEVTGNIFVFYYKVDDFQITNVDFAFKEIAHLFEVTQSPVTDPEMLKSSQADGGIMLTVRIKPGLELGAFRQTMYVKTNLSGGAVEDIAVRGVITSDISFLGPKFSPKNQELNMGTVRRGDSTTVLALIKGQYRNDVQFEVASIHPEKSLRVELTAPEPFGEAATKIALNISIPDDAEPIALLGGAEVENYGKIVLRTTHPDVERVTIYVRFAVQE